MTLPARCPLNDDEGRGAHAWMSTGLHIVKGKLCTTRCCVRCGAEQSKPYGAGSRKGWAATTS